jgi:hypothetical protein
MANELLDDENFNNGDGSLSALTFLQMEKVAYWSRFYSILVFSLLGITGLLFFGILFSIPGLKGNIGLGIGLVLAILAFAAWQTSLLYSYGNGLTEYIATKESATLEYALGRRKLFWLVSVVVTVVFVLIAVVALLGLR